MLCYTALLLSFLSSFIAANSLGHAAEKCSLELEGIVYDPQTYANKYMKYVAAKFRQGAPLLFTPSADSYIESFEQDWGVTVSIAEAFDVCPFTVTTGTCYSTDADTLSKGSGFLTFNVTQDIVIKSMSLSINGTANGSNVGLGTYNLTSPTSTLIELASTPVCGSVNSQGDFSFNFTDGGAASLDCNTSQNLDLALDPTEPLSTFAGQSSLGIWELAYDNSELDYDVVTLYYCAEDTTTTFCSRDIMRAMTNFPGFRYDSVTQTVYYTEDVFDSNGNFRQVTISRPMAGLFLKK